MTEQGWVAGARAVIADGEARVLFLEDGDRLCLPFVEVEGTDDPIEFLPVIRSRGSPVSRRSWCEQSSAPSTRSARCSSLEDDERERLSALEPHFVEMCERLAAGAVPDALVHGDLHLSNVAGDSDGYVFFDWTDACLAHPFLDLLVVLFEEDAGLRQSLRDAYLAVWEGVAPDGELLELWALAEPLASLNQVISYRSITANVEREAAPEFESMTPYWLRKALASCEQT